MADRNEPEEYRKIEQDAQKLSAQISADMLRHPRSRWLLQPIRRLMKWIEKTADERLKEDGWR